MESKKYWIWLSRIQGLDNKKIIELLKKFKSPEQIWKLTEKELNSLELEERIVNKILNKQYRTNLCKYVEYMNKNNIDIITFYDKEYPKNLRNIYCPPICLYVKGDKKILNEKSIGIVGCRLCSKYGKEVAIKLSSSLAKYNINIVSGLARGIDKYGHLGCIEGRGKTIAVLGNGLDTIYPFENTELARQIIKTGGTIVSEYIIGTNPNKENFPARNRIISGLSNGIVVIEAKRRSGSMITVENALEQGKEVFAVPRKYK